MLLLEPDRTPYDLNWRMFGIPVRVHPWFWLVSAIMGWNAMRDGFEYLLLWIGCVFISILIHELGHVFMGRIFGSDGHIVLYSFGGLAIGSSDLFHRWQRIAVSFAGPLAGFLFFGLVAVSDFFPVFHDPRNVPPLVADAIRFLFFINLIWGIFNLFPIWPLDGGQISREVFDWLMPRSGIKVSLGISVALAALLAIGGLFLKMIFFTLMFGFLAFSSFQALQQVRARQTWDSAASDPWEHNRAPWERDPDYWKK